MKRVCMPVMVLVILLGVLVSSGHTTIVTLSPTLDTYVSSANPNDAFGSRQDLYSGYYTYYSFNETLRSFLKFDLSSIPNNSVITSANLTLSNSYLSNPDWSMNVNRVQNDASVSNATTWANQPGVAENMSSLTMTTTGRLTWNLQDSGLWSYSSDLTDDVLSLRLSSGSEGTHGFATFRSFEYTGGSSDRPTLTIEYQPAPVPIPGAAWLLGSGLVGLISVGRKFRRKRV